MIRKKTSDPEYFTKPNTQVDELNCERKLVEYYANVGMLNMLIDRKIEQDGLQLASDRFLEYTSGR